MSADHEALHYTVFTSPLLARPWFMCIFSAPYSRSSSAHAIPLNVRDQILGPYNTTGKILILYISVFLSLKGRREG